MLKVESRETRQGHMTDSKLEAALALAQRGFKVFPLRENDKKPLFPGANWQTLATSDAKTITRWWRDPVTQDEHDYNIGIATNTDRFVLDIDVNKGFNGEQSLATLTALYDDLPDTLQVETPSGGRHIYLTINDHETGISAGKVGSGIDVRGKGGYVVGPGSTIGDKAYRVISERPIAKAPDWLKTFLPKYKHRSSEPLAQATDDPYAATLAAHMLQKAAPAIDGDGGDMHTLKIAMRLRDYGLSPQTALELMLDHWNERCEPPWPVDELEQKIRNAYKYAKEPAGTKDPKQDFQPLDKQTTLIPPFDRWDATKIKARPWLIGKLALRGKLTEIIAPPGVGKSTFTIAVALGLAAGKPILGMTIHERVATAIYNNEDDRDELDRRVLAAMQHHGLTPADLRDKEGTPLFYTQTGDMRPLTIAKRILQGGLDKIAAQDAAQLIADLKAARIGCLVVDPFSETHGAQENDNGAMLTVMQIMRDIAQQADCAIIIVHHTNKPPAASAEGRQGSLESGRGASAIGQAVRVAATLYGMTEAEAEDYGIPIDQRHWYVRLDEAKGNLAVMSGDPLWFRRVSVGLGVAGRLGGQEVEQVGTLECVQLTAKEKRQAGAAAAAVLAAFQALGGEATARAAADWIEENDPLFEGSKPAALLKTVRREIEAEPERYEDTGRLVKGSATGPKAAVYRLVCTTEL
jgi:hypothetical protein